MGKLTNLNPPAPIADTDLPASIARDAEYIAADTAHLNALDPHSQYLTQTEFLTADFFFQVSAPNLLANSWQDVGPLLALGVASQPRVWLVTLYFQYPDGNTLPEHWQYCGAGVLGAVLWKANGLSNGVAIEVETHTEIDYTVRVRGGLGQARRLQLNPNRTINIPAPGFLRVYFKRLG
jgi:hypothetical protein